MKVPNIIVGANVICYAVVNLVLSAADGKRLAFGLAICKYETADGFYMFYCDDNWVEFADTWHETVEDAKDQAEDDYPGISKFWNTST